MSKKTEKALSLYSNGFNCSQAVVGAFCEDLGVKEEIGMGFAGGFGGGIQWGEICGAITGACMIIGLKYGQTTLGDTEARKTCSNQTGHFLRSFQEKENSLLCRELLGYDVRDKEAKVEFKGDYKAICTSAIRNAVEILEEMGF